MTGLNTMTEYITQEQSVAIWKMAGVALPEPVGFRIPEPETPSKHHYFDASEIRSCKEKLEAIYTADQLRQAVADALSRYDKCAWQPHDDVHMPGTWETPCGELYTFSEGTPKENNFNFCHHCGKAVNIKSDKS